jgi:hypothetical protein
VVVPVVVAEILVTAVHPVALKGRLRLLVLLPVAGGRALTADHEGTDTAAGSGTPSSSTIRPK